MLLAKPHYFAGSTRRYRLAVRLTIIFLTGTTMAWTVSMASLTPSVTPSASHGRQLYLMNCAHCHARDASGDDGPDLHGVERSDPSLASLIQNGKKGQMPKFSSKLSASDVQDLIAYLHTLKSRGNR